MTENTSFAFVQLHRRRTLIRGDVKIAHKATYDGVLEIYHCSNTSLGLHLQNTQTRTISISLPLHKVVHIPIQPCRSHHFLKVPPDIGNLWVCL